MDDEVPLAPSEGITPHESRLPYEGEDLGRVLALSDGIFAFAMTLLVLDLAVPAQFLSSTGLAAYLAGQRGPFFAYLVGFLIIGSFWVGHHRLFRHLRRWNTLLLWLNIVFLVTVAVEPFAIGVYMKEGPSFPSVALVATDWAVSGALLSLIWLYASHRRRLVDGSLTDTYVRSYAQNLAVTPTVFALSIGVALLAPDLAQYVWLGGVVAQAVFRRKIAMNALPPVKPVPAAPGTPATARTSG